jgi:hypothetical protein
MKKVVLALVIAACTMSVKAQDRKYEKIIYKDSKTENKDIVITVENAVSTVAETKFKLKITNKTNDYILFKPEECVFIINGKEASPKEKSMIIDPNDSDYRVVNLKGAFNTVKNYSFKIDGLYRIPSNAKGIESPDFRLPPTKNDFSVGGFNVNLNKLSKESGGTDVKFNVSYNGDKIGFIFPSKSGVLMPDKNEYAMANSKAHPIMLMKGEDDSFTLHWNRMEGGKAMDMQKVEMFIKWNGTFSETSPEKMNPETVQMQFDDLLSK